MPEALESLTSYPSLFILCFLCGLAIPLPEDVPQLFAGMQIARGKLEWLPAIAAAILGVFVRDLLFFGLGQRLGERALVSPLAQRLIGEARIERAREGVRGRGPVAVLIGRISIGVRVSTFFVSGAMGVRTRDFVLWDGLALLVTTPLLLALGFWFGQPVLDGALYIASRASWAVPALVIALIGVWWWRSASPSN
ncbi:MAG: DedA family protein [Proteobacteria bacterium]|nr:DedA family protein [Pseudomonadota bacterium]